MVEGLEEAVGMGALQVALHALGAQLALVEREVVPGLEADHPLGGPQAATLDAAAAVLRERAAARAERRSDPLNERGNNGERDRTAIGLSTSHQTVYQEKPIVAQSQALFSGFASERLDVTPDDTD